MTALTLCLAGSAMLAYSLLGRWLGKRYVTAPMVLLILGAVASGFVDQLNVEGATVHTIAEVTLVLILFHDASTVKLSALRGDLGPPVRLLAIGFPCALVVTGLASWLLLPAIGIYGALLIAAAITPTDAGLGAPTVLNPVVPVRIRRALNVESGLNDGLATPIVLFALTALAAPAGESIPRILEFAVGPLLGGVAVGAVGAALIAGLLNVAQRRGIASKHAAPVTVLLVPLLLFVTAELFHANVFIAAFIGGLAFGAVSKTLGETPEVAELVETAGELASWAVWFLAGALTVEVFGDGISWQSCVIALLALTVLRMGPVALAMIGTGFRPPTVAFIGWFGPRGLATVVFALLVVEELGVRDPVVEPVVLTLALGVVLSVFAHGISATPLAGRYGRWVADTRPAAETETAPEPSHRGFAPTSS